MPLFEKRHSPIHGFGLFAIQDIRIGKLLINWMRESEVINRSDYDPTNQTSIQLVGNLFIDGEKTDNDYINHSDDPNCIYIFGMVFAQQNISIGDELTLDYSYLLPEHEQNVVWGHPMRDKLKDTMAFLLDHIDYLEV